MYLESRAVLHQGLLNQKELHPADMQQIKLWTRQHLMECTPIKNPPKIKNPMFTHKIRLSETLFMKAWQIRLAKAEQFTPLKKLSDKIDYSDLPGIAVHMLAADPDDLSQPPNPAVTYEEFEAWLAEHKAKLMPVQQQLAKDIFGVFGKTKHRGFINIPRSGKSWLLKAIDQFLTARKKSKQKKSNPPVTK
jgi:hypothetical protein